jgi:hypothetical protein
VFDVRRRKILQSTVQGFPCGDKLLTVKYVIETQSRVVNSFVCVNKTLQIHIKAEISLQSNISFRRRNNKTGLGDVLLLLLYFIKR